MKTAIVSVTNDLTTDQRVHRTCTALSGLGYRVVLVGRHLRHSKPLAPRSYATERMRLLFDKGPLFYAEYNLSLFFYLLLRKADLIVTNDLDTLPAGWFASVLKRIPVVHDCHEYFRGVPELVGRRFTARVWKYFEDLIFPKLKYIMAVNESIASIYSNEYKKPVKVMRNVPFRKEPCNRDKTGIPGVSAENKVIMYQGAVNIGRGLEEAVLAMKETRKEANLVIAGIGDISRKLEEMVKQEGLAERVIFLGQVPFQELHQYTCCADIGLSIEKDLGINYQNCLPNKFLDYIQARVPVLVSPFHEMKQVVEKYDIGEFITGHEPAYLAERFNAMLGNETALARYREGAGRAAQELCWENESKVLTDLIASIP